MQEDDPHYTKGQKLAATTVGVVAALAVAVFAASVAIEFGVRSDFATGIAVQSTLPLMFVFWKWPGLVLKPIAYLREACGGSASNDSAKAKRWLREPAQRALFAIGCGAIAPWLVLRVPSEVFRESNAADYLREVVLSPWACLFRIDGWYSCDVLNWYDMMMPFGVVALALALSWQKTGGRLLSWIVGGR